MNKKDLLLHIDVHELPVSYIIPAIKEIKRNLLDMLNKERIAFSSEENIFIGANKNTLLVYVKDVSVKQRASSEELLGPPKRIAFDKDNKPTKQLLGFAKSQNVKPEMIKILKTPKGEYLGVEKVLPALRTEEVLKKEIPKIIQNLYFPKTMRWDSSALRFARPIRDIIIVLGEKRIPIKLISSNKKTKSLSFSASKYLQNLKKKYILDPFKREEKIKDLILKVLKKIGADLTIDNDLLREVSFLVNDPDIFVSDFDKKYLDVPEDVLKASMSKHQRIFPVSKNKKIINKFIAIIDGKSKNNVSVKKHYRYILEARLKDSLFFLKEDLKKELDAYKDQLKDLIFQNSLGTMFEKIDRLGKISSYIVDSISKDNGSLKKHLVRAAELSKADLVTQMVGEFPSLQGSIGSEYAKRMKEDKEVSQAIKEHYMPKGFDGDLPTSLEGSILSIADRIDNLVGFIGIGTDLSSSNDPYGLRRNANGLIQIIINKKLDLDITQLVGLTLKLYKDKIEDNKNLSKTVHSYLLDRFSNTLGDVKPHGLKESVLVLKDLSIKGMNDRLKVLKRISDKKYFLKAAKVVERTKNIIKNINKSFFIDVSESLLKEDLEKSLWKAYKEHKEDILDAIKKSEFEEATKLYSEVFYDILSRFFDSIIVNAKEHDIKANRLSMMKAINSLYSDNIADLSKIPQIVV